ncbi:MAG: UTP--glucose-1-phosphate uridylyltransferase GalU [Bacteroidales bacterium]|nr:UTP--glucose-1-phosphate uridylyltransferase GalU [Bacteroidales bacterium]MCF8390800.1 UTP--glucose-1-phosphate uridylyltransferase GalU [Bacteroidales bacterium]
MIRKAVIPAAGFGTRFLPATKSQPKEMLPIVDTPTIQHVVEEAVESGITDILMIIGKGKRSIEEHFDRNFELEAQLLEKNMMEDLIMMRKINSLANIHFIYQKELNGLGDAISYARYHVNNEPFAVLLGDTLIESNNDIPVTRQLMEVYNKYHSSVVAVEEVHPSLVSRYGIIDGDETDKDIFKVKDFIEKPDINTAPSNLAIASRYIFTPEIFEFLDNVKPGKNNEIQITDAMQAMVKHKPWHALKFDGKRHDIGNKLDFLKTNVVYGLKRKDIGDEFRLWLKEYISD